METVPSLEAWRRFDQDPTALWYEDSSWAVQPHGSAARRLSEGQPDVTAEISIADNTASWFCMGSCFARNVEEALAAEGQRVLSLTDLFDGYSMATQMPGRPYHVTNKYNVFSILQSLQWAFGHREFSDRCFVQAKDGRWTDLHSHHALGTQPLDVVKAQRDVHNSVVRRIAEADTIILTLGLTEVWYDHETETVLNSTPAREITEGNPQRFGFRNTNFAENMMAIQGIQELLDRHVSGPVIVSVSPVPLRATFTGQDVIVANAYSKAVLRAAAQEWAEMAHVQYFPAYEMVTSLPREAAYLSDLNHVAPRVVRQVISSFLESVPASLAEDHSL